MSPRLRYHDDSARRFRYLEVGEAVGEEDMPPAEEELLLADTQQTCDQRVQGLRTEEITIVSDSGLPQGINGSFSDTVVIDRLF